MKQLLLIITGYCVSGCYQSTITHATAEQNNAVTVVASAETTPVGSPGDAADDAALWIHPHSPEKSRVLGTDKRQGLEVYDLSGQRLQSLATGRLNNIDVRQNVKWGGRLIDIAVATNRTTRSLDLFEIDAASGTVTPMPGSIALTLAEPYGICLYHKTNSGKTNTGNSNSGALYAFVNDKDGRYQQWALRPEPLLVNSFSLASQPEGCVVDDDHAVIYLGEEERGLWRINLEQAGPLQPLLIDSVANGRLSADVEGIALYKSDKTQGFLIVSSQGDNSYAVYERQGNNNYIGSFRIARNARLGIDGTSETDGLAVTHQSLGKRFPAGLLVVQDGQNSQRQDIQGKENQSGENQNFKYISWQAIAQALGIKR